MKKIIVFLLIMMLVLTGCGAKETPEDSDAGSEAVAAEEGTAADEDAEEGAEAADEEEGEELSVDKGLLNVEITLPASMFEGQDINTIIEEAKADGVKEVTQNDDGSVTYKMPKSVYNAMLQEMKDGFVEIADDMKTSGDYASIQDVTYNDDMSEITLVVKKADYENSMDAFAVMGLGIGAMYYQIFENGSEEDIKVTINTQDVDSGEVFNTVVYPDAFEE